jgi:peptidoglycan/xylan/chitin deacetylase (PgdA/CDA1 family)
MSDLVKIIKNNERKKHVVVLTFDDGFSNIIRNAYPIIKEYGANGCFYLVSDLVATGRMLWTDYIETIVRKQKRGKFQFTFKGEKINYHLTDKKSYEHAMKDIKAKLRLISDKERHEHLNQYDHIILDDIPTEFSLVDWEQVKILDPDVLEIGSHTKRHPDCVKLGSEEEIEDEIYNSKIDIEKMLGYKIIHFCYPAGSYDDRIITKLKEYDYQSAVTIDYGFNDSESDLFRLKRIGVTESFLLFKANVSGSYSILRKIKTILT